MASSYAGESIAKKVCRVRLYRRTRAAWRDRRVDSKQAKVIFLPGPEAAEVGALKHILGVHPENVLAIDRDAEACGVAEERWPGIRALHGDLGKERTHVEALAFLKGQDPAAAFVHLDLMGNLSEQALKSYVDWCSLCQENGVLAVTYLRGRELPESLGGRMKAAHRDLFVKLSPSALEARLRAPGPLPMFAISKELYRILSADFDRASSHFTAIQVATMTLQAIAAGALSLDGIFSWLGSTKELEARVEAIRNYEQSQGDSLLTFTPLATYCYRAEVSPMGVLVLHRITRATLNSDGYTSLRHQRGRDTSSVIKKDPMEDLLAEADSLEKEFTREQVAEILNVSPGTLTAWRAHRTMGTYAR